MRLICEINWKWEFKRQNRIHEIQKCRICELRNNFILTVITKHLNFHDSFSDYLSVFWGVQWPFRNIYFLIILFNRYTIHVYQTHLNIYKPPKVVFETNLALKGCWVSPLFFTHHIKTAILICQVCQSTGVEVPS